MMGGGGVNQYMIGLHKPGEPARNKCNEVMLNGGDITEATGASVVFLLLRHSAKSPISLLLVTWLHVSDAVLVRQRVHDIDVVILKPETASSNGVSA